MRGGVEKRHGNFLGRIGGGERGVEGKRGRKEVSGRLEVWVGKRVEEGE